jgi:uncharacterized membrane-anchored protein YhcB (DUF1043 family)
LDYFQSYIIWVSLATACSDNRIQEFSLLAGTTAAIAVLIAFLAKWNVVLTREVKKRTQTLEEEFEEMKSYLEKVQNELSKHR